LVILFFAIPRHGTGFSAAARRLAEWGGADCHRFRRANTLAILPFRVLGGEDSLNYVADGLGEALTAKLFQLNDVRSRPPTPRKNHDQKPPLPQIAKDLGVNMNRARNGAGIRQTTAHCGEAGEYGNESAGWSQGVQRDERRSDDAGGSEFTQAW